MAACDIPVEEDVMNRRELMASAGAAAVVLVSSAASADEHAGHDHATMAALSPETKLIDTASNCINLETAVARPFWAERGKKC